MGGRHAEYIKYSSTKIANTNIVTDEENVAGVGAPVALVGREAGRWLQAGGGGGGACVEPSCS